MDWISTIEQAFDESIQDLGVDMDEACDNGTYPKARDNVIDAVAAIFSDDYDPRIDKLKEVPVFRVYNAYTNLQLLADYMHTRMTERSDKLDKAEAENKELRELVQDMWRVMWACAERTCPHHHDDCYRVFGNGTSLPRGQGECWFEKRMAELRVKEDR